MKRIMEQLWNGQITPYRKYWEQDEELQAVVDLVDRNKTALYSALTEKQKGLLENYVVCNDEYVYLSSVCAFSEGFSLAAKLLTQALTDGEK